MRQMICGATIAVVLMGAVAAGQATTQAPPAPPAPAPGSPGIFKSAQDLAEVLKRATAAAGGMSASEVGITDQYRVNVVTRVKPAGALAHAGNTELHYILDGSATLVTGGSIVRGATAGAATIANGVTRKVSKGDAIIVPENSPHWYSAVEGSVTYLEIRWLAPR